MDRTILDQLVGQKEIADEYGVSRALVNDWAKRPGFPAPAVVLGAGRFWLRPDVQAWHAGRKA